MTDATAALAIELIQRQKTLVLATADPEPWCAPVYYVYRKQRFYFFSSAKSRHVTAGLASKHCAGSIFRDSDDWREIEGLQMDGSLQDIHMGAEAMSAFSAYLKKYPTVKGFFADAAFDLNQFRERFRTQLYAFTPERVFYLNNQAGLGKRQEIQLPV
jgi:uncharacterized protein YhbP (UPF0306 family)